MTVIVKVQLPMFGDYLGETPVLIQDEDKSIELTIESDCLRDSLMKQLKGDLVGYFQADIDPDSKDIMFKKRLPKQNW